MLLVVIEVEATDGGRVFWAQAEVTVMQPKGVEVLPQFLSEAGEEEVAALYYRCVDEGVASFRQECVQGVYDPLLLLMGFR